MRLPERITASVSEVFRGNDEGVVFSKMGPFSASKYRNVNPSTGNDLRLETKGPAHDRAGHLVPRTGFEPVLPEPNSKHPILRSLPPRSL